MELFPNIAECRMHNSQMRNLKRIRNEEALNTFSFCSEQRPARVFTNNIVVRFHPGLEIDGDEVITIVCRYPTPIVPVPAP